MSEDDTFREMKDINALATAATDAIAVVADKKKMEMEA